MATRRPKVVPCSSLAAADHDEVVRRGAAADLAQAALEADAGDVMLAASVRAAADLDVEAGDRLDEVGPLVEAVGEEPAEAARLRHRQLARLGARAAGDVGDGAGVRRGRARAAASRR